MLFINLFYNIPSTGYPCTKHCTFEYHQNKSKQTQACIVLCNYKNNSTSSNYNSIIFCSHFLCFLLNLSNRSTHKRYTLVYLPQTIWILILSCSTLDSCCIFNVASWTEVFSFEFWHPRIYQLHCCLIHDCCLSSFVIANDTSPDS